MIRIKVWSIKRILTKCAYCIAFIFTIVLIIIGLSKLAKSVPSSIIIENVTSKISSTKYSEPTSIISIAVAGQIMLVPKYKAEKQIEKIGESITKLHAEKIGETKIRIGTVLIENYTKRELDLEKLSTIKDNTLSKSTSFLIYHTHTSESYSGIENYSDYYRTEDNTANVVSVGKTLSTELKKYGYFVTQNMAAHDYPSYSGAYKSSLSAIQKYKKQFDIYLDIHRDAIASDEHFRPVVQINGKDVAKLMFVVGTDTAGLEHNSWEENLKFAIAVQSKANELYPGLFRDVHLSTSRYNQHVSTKALIVEVGATGNTLDEANLAVKYLAEILESL